MAKLSRNAIIGYSAGIITGITYGLNPLFAKPLMNDGAFTEAILFFRSGAHSGVPLPRNGSNHHGLPEGCSFMVGMAVDRCNIRRSDDNDWRHGL